MSLTHTRKGDRADPYYVSQECAEAWVRCLPGRRRALAMEIEAAVVYDRLRRASSGSLPGDYCWQVACGPRLSSAYTAASTQARVGANAARPDVG